jgi:hypothetical protein
MDEQAKIEAAKRAIEQPLDDEIRAPPPAQWMASLDERTQKHVVFAQNYAAFYAHGAPGHLDLMTIATLAKLLDQYQDHKGPPVERPS